MSKGKRVALVFGILCIILGTLYTLKFIGVLPSFTILHISTLTLPVVIPSLISVIRKGFKRANTIFLAIGLYMFAACFKNLYFMWSFFFPASLFIVGFILIFGSRLFKTRRIIDAETGEIIIVPMYISAFGQLSESNGANPLNGASLHCVMGGMCLDFTPAVIDSDIVIEITSIFGAAEVKLPADVNVAVRRVPILGTIECKRGSDVIIERPTVHLRVSAIASHVEII